MQQQQQRLSANLPMKSLVVRSARALHARATLSTPSTSAVGRTFSHALHRIAKASRSASPHGWSRLLIERRRPHP